MGRDGLRPPRGWDETLATAGTQKPQLPFQIFLPPGSNHPRAAGTGQPAENGSWEISFPKLLAEDPPKGWPYFLVL